LAQRGAAGRRYAQAVFEIARDTGTLDRWLADLQAINTIFGNDAAVGSLENPKLTEETKRGIVDDLLSKTTVGPLVRNLVLLLVHRSRLSLVPRIVEAFGEMYNKEKGIVVAEVTTAVPLDEAHIKRVGDRLSQITGKKVDLRTRTDPRILGGMITRIGDELIDSSVATRLAELADRIS
jgi:F-type H+-transporting ATPase subunit delta